jgi:SAM-dependent methyltransferase
MAAMGLMTQLLERTMIYSLWQAPFAADKVAPLLAHNDLREVRRVLDVGCGPGTNTPLFTHADYLGIDINQDYIEHARRKYKRPFVAADVTTYDDNTLGKFDFILINSFLHHLNDADTRRVLCSVAARLSEGGQLHILELVSPQDHSIAQLLANWDRGKYPRPLEEWRALFGERLDVTLFEPYPLRLLGTTLWNMVYCKGRAKA